MGLGTDQMTITSGDKFIPEIWKDEVRAFLRASLVLADKVKMIEMEGRKGDVIHIPDVSELAVSTKAANTQVTLQAPVETEFTLTINQHKESSIVIEDLLAIQAMYDLRSEYTKSMGYAQAKFVDKCLATLHGTLSSRLTGSGVAIVGSVAAVDITEAGLRQTIETMDTANVPDDGGRCLFIHPAQKNVMLGISRFTEYQIIGAGGMPIRTGQFGEIFGLPVYVSTQVQATQTAHANILFHRDAFALAVQSRPRVQAQYKQEYLGWLFTVDMVYGYAIFRNNHATAIVTPQ